MIKADEWTEDETERLAALLKSGITAREIAERLGRTRNAVLGRAHRLGITTRNPRPRKAEPPKYDLRQRGDMHLCQWINGEPEDGEFCHRPIEEGHSGPWCAKHAKRVYRQVEQHPDRPHYRH